MMVMIAAAASAGPVRQDQALEKHRPRLFSGVAASAPALIRALACLACTVAGRTEEGFTRRVWGARTRWGGSSYPVGTAESRVAVAVIVVGLLGTEQAIPNHNERMDGGGGVNPSRLPPGGTAVQEGRA